MAAWVDVTSPGYESGIADVGFSSTRWPGGEESDKYHWNSNTSCGGGFTVSKSTFDNFIADIAQPAKLDVAVTLNYGSNQACSGGGDPTEAAAWVAHAKSLGDHIKWWTVGNEQYQPGEFDLHSKPHDAATYAAAVATGYYPAIKAADPEALVGVDVNANPSWDSIVLSKAKYDFVETHYYSTVPGKENDEDLLKDGAPGLTTQINAIKAELALAGRSNTPIYVGEIGSVYDKPGKQTMSIVQGLYAGMILGELMNDDIARAAWWLAYASCDDASSGANFSTTLYGWQNFGGFELLSGGMPSSGCKAAPSIAAGTPYPPARAYQMMASVIKDGEKALDVETAPSLPVRAYAATQGLGYAVILFNLSKTASTVTNIAVDTLPAGMTASLTTYGKAQYDNTKEDVWLGPTTRSLGPWRSGTSISLAPWSMNVLEISPL